MKNDFALAFKQILEDRGLPQEVVLTAIEDAMVSAYRRAVHASNAQHVEAKIDSETGEVKIYAEKEVVEDIQDNRTEVLLKVAKSVEPEAELGDMVIVESTPDDFGRVAAQTARQVIQQRIREAERDAQHDYYAKQVGDIVNGVVQAINNRHISLGLDMKAEGIMPRKHQIPREFFRVHDRVRALLQEVQNTNRGPKIVLSRAHPDFLRRLLENEVPEIYHGMVEIRSIAREPGQRSKVAVAALQPGVDPVGACVGIRGVRIQAIVRELNDEKIDVIEWNPDPEVYIAKALSPARVLSVYLEDHEGPNTATIIVPEDQLSLAIGRDGQNARLTAKLTGWRIDIKSLIEATSEVLFKLNNNPEYSEFAKREKETLPLIESLMKKKAEGRPITPEDYQEMQAFCDRVEQGRIDEQRAILLEKEQRTEAALATIPNGAFDLPLLTLGFSDRLISLLEDNEIKNVGDLMFQINLDPTTVRQIDGIGPKSMADIEAALEVLVAAMPEPESEVEEITDADTTETIEAETPEEEITEPEIDAVQEQLSEVEAITETEEITEEVPSETIEPEVSKPEGEEIPATMEEIFKLEPEMLDTQTPSKVSDDTVETDEESIDIDEILDDEETTTKKRKKYVEVEYDPDRDVTIYRKKRKRGEKDWEEWNEEDDWDS